MRIAVIGDIGGHAEQLRHELARLGAHDDGALPADLIVIQVGDLIHRGPDSDAAVRMVDRYIRSQPGQWIQLIGNHELNYLRPPLFRWPEELSRKNIRNLNRWWRNGAAHVAAAVDTASESFLITHAGVTAEFWATVLRGPATAAEAARHINELARAGAESVFCAGAFLNGTATQDVGPLWADAASELLPGWADRHLPFSQIHGHSNITAWRIEKPAVTHSGVDALVTIDAAAKHEFVHLSGGRLIGIDPDHRDTPTLPWRGLELYGTITV